MIGPKPVTVAILESRRLASYEGRDLDLPDLTTIIDGSTDQPESWDSCNLLFPELGGITRNRGKVLGAQDYIHTCI